MPVRKSSAEWKGGLKKGSGSMSLESGTFSGPFSFTTRFENEPGTNPEELIGAAHAGCFSMAFSNELDKQGFTPKSVQTIASVTLEKKEDGFAITSITLDTKAHVPGIDEKTFQQTAEAAKNGCPVSKALAAVDIKLKAALIHND